MSARRDVIFALALWQTQGLFPNTLLADSEDHAFALELLGATLRHKAELDWLLRQCVKKMPTGETYAALLIGAAQLWCMPKVTPYAAISETVNAIKPAGKTAAAFVNAVLRNIQRSEPALRQRLLQQPEALQRNIPAPLWKRWVADYGLEQTRAMAEAIAQPHPIHVRWLRGGVVDTRLVHHPLDEQEDCTSRTFCVPPGIRIEEIAGFDEGAFVVQDIATRHAIELLDVHPGQRILDACAAPGGKTAQIVALLQGQGEILALEKAEARLEKLKDTVRRCHGMDVVTVRQGDATQMLDGMFDRILIDAPCSNTGVFGKRPDARWTWSAQKTKMLIETQRALLNACAKRLVPGGILVYSTCSIDKEENQRQVAAFLASHPEFIFLKERLELPSSYGDGAYAAALQKV